MQTVSQLFHLGERLSNENPVASQEELEDLKCQASEERAQQLAREMEICDLKDKVKDLERTAEVSSADALAAGKRNSELEESMGTLKLEMVMAVNGARVIARWELMREWFKGQSNQWDLAKALEQYKAITLEEAKKQECSTPDIWCFIHLVYILFNWFSSLYRVFLVIFESLQVWSCIGWEMDQLEQKRQKTMQFGGFHAEQS